MINVLVHMCVYTHVSVALAADCLYIRRIHVHTPVSMYRKSGNFRVKKFSCDNFLW